MTDLTTKLPPIFSGRRSTIAKMAMVSVIALSVAACRGHQDDSYVAGWLRIDHDEMHPITVSKQPSTLSIPIHRGTYGLAPGQQARLSRFLARYKARDTGNSNLLVHVPSGSANEVEAMQVVGELRHVISEYGFDPTLVKVKPYQARRGSQPPIRVSYMRYVAKGPQCGTFPTNIARQFDNRHYEDYGCSVQKNIAAQIANPADLLGPRTMTPRSEARRADAWEKYVTGKPTHAERSNEEKAGTTDQ